MLAVFMAVMVALLCLTAVYASASPTLVDGMEWNINPTENSNWETYYYPGYHSLLSELKESQPTIYSEVTNALDGDAIPSTYDASWVKSANSALLDWQKSAFQSDQLEQTYMGLPIPTVTVVYVSGGVDNDNSSGNSDDFTEGRELVLSSFSASNGDGESKRSGGSSESSGNSKHKSASNSEDSSSASFSLTASKAMTGYFLVILSAMLFLDATATLV
ncbi:hypothetical protein EV182_003534 [Spiromyces aspiralis]|uniref:Uncharacterized protein n=1 Tax=Spiromyces aspiralis TaxID=68401 RepID=A0ACC1HF15_9FUNG|nr:hypothetical protein EV182_003534 [Spiromyces aspiralis]